MSSIDLWRGCGSRGQPLKYTVDILLQHGASLELRNSSKETALLVGISQNRYAEAKRLVDAGGDYQDVIAYLESKGAIGQ